MNATWSLAAVILLIALMVFVGRMLPPVVRVLPGDGTVDVSRDARIEIRRAVPFLSPAFDPDYADASNVKMYPSGRPSDIVDVDVFVAQGGHSIVLRPATLLASNTPYVVEVSDGIMDVNGRRVAPHMSSFRTGAQPLQNLPGVHFDQTVLPGTAGPFTSLAVGPDGRLYAAQYDGWIKRWSIAYDGTLRDIELLDALRAAEGGNRLLVGLAFDPASTADSVMVWVTHTTFGLYGMDDWGGKITRLSGPALNEVQDYVINLPRSNRDHVTNGAAFGPDGALYVGQGGNTSLGAVDPTWGDRPERLLSAAILRIDVKTLSGGAPLPIDVKTADGGTYDPFAEGAPVTVYASGVRNSYDLAWHTNGYLYSPHNGSAPGGRTPASVTGAVRPNGKRYSHPHVPQIDDGRVRDDYLYRIFPPDSNGRNRYRYYGHPNSSRGEYVLDGGNPTARIDPGEVADYEVGIAPDEAWEGFVYNFGRHLAPTGIIEYGGDAFGGALKGHLLVTMFSQRFGGNIVTLRPDSSGRIEASGHYPGISGLTGFDNPLDLTENPETGDIYVSQYRGSEGIVLLRPTSPSLAVD